MAIAFDAFTDGSNLTGTSLTWNHTCTGSNGYLFVLTVGDLTSDLITGVTYNTVAMTKLGVVQCPSDRFTTWWGLLNPASGTHQVAVTASSSIFLTGVSASYTGVGSNETTATNTAATAANVTGTVTTTAANCWTVAGFRNDSGPASAGTNATSRGTGGDTALAIMDSNGALAAGSHTLQATNAANPNWAVLISSLAPAAAAASPGTPNESTNPRTKSGKVEQLPFAVNTTLTTLSLANTKPFKQTEWPNPLVVPRRIEQVPFVVNIRPTTLSLLNTKPFKMDDWVTPVKTFALAAILGTLSPNLLGNTLKPGVQTPFNGSVQDVPRTSTQRAAYTPFEQNLLGTTLAQTAAPFKPVDWPIFQGRSFSGTEHTNRDVSVTPTSPFVPIEFPNPHVRAKVYDWNYSVTRTIPVVPPFVPVDFPNPHVKAKVYDWNYSVTRTIPVGPKPFAQNDWPLPNVRRQPLQDWQYSITGYLPTGAKPFSQLDWPNPVRLRVDLTFTQPSLFIPDAVVDIAAPNPSAAGWFYKKHKKKKKKLTPVVEFEHVVIIPQEVPDLEDKRVYRYVGDLSSGLKNIRIQMVQASEAMAMAREENARIEAASRNRKDEEFLILLSI